MYTTAHILAQQINTIIKASWVGVVGNALLSAIKIFAGIISGSLAVLADGIDSASDIVTSIITLITAKVLARPPDAKYPYGYSKADTLAAKALSFVILFAGAQLAITTITGLVQGHQKEIPGDMAIYVTIFSIAGKLFLSVYQFRKGKQTRSEMLMANAKNMQNDVLISCAVLLGLVFTFLLKMPVLDSITALFVSIWILKVGFQIFMQTNRDLMDSINDPELYRRVFEVVEEIDGTLNPHRLRIRKIGNEYMIAFDIEADGSLTVDQAHELACKIEIQIKSAIENIFDVMIHIEPAGNVHHEKKYGVNKTDLLP